MQPEEIQDIQEALKALSEDDLKSLGVLPQTQDENSEYVAIKMQLVSLVKDLLQQNMALEWEINKIRPAPVNVETIIESAQKLYNFVTSKE